MNLPVSGKPSTLPRLRLFAFHPAGGPPSTLIELLADRPPWSVIVVVLDLSDSCTPMSAEIARISALLAAIPRAWPLWCYRLSSPTPLDPPEGWTIGNLLDDSALLSNRLEDRQLLATARSAGSFLRPPLEAIKMRLESLQKTEPDHLSDKSSEPIRAVTVLVLTDGELLDSAPVEIPPRFRFVGVTGGRDQRKTAHWARVLPQVPLMTLSDAALDSAVRADAYPFFGRCVLKWSSSAVAPLIMSALDAQTQGFLSSRLGECECGLADGPTYLLASAPVEITRKLRWTCRSRRTADIATLTATIATEPPNPAVQALLANPAATSIGEIALDLQSDHTDFSAALAAMKTGIALAGSHAEWTSPGRAGPFFEHPPLATRLININGKPKFDAILCLLDPIESHIVVVGMRRSQKPALRWNVDSPPSFATLIQAVEIYFDRLEGRWMIQCGDEDLRELEPCGSEQLDLPLAQSASLPWIAIFSGELHS